MSEQKEKWTRSTSAAGGNCDLYCNDRYQGTVYASDPSALADRITNGLNGNGKAMDPAAVGKLVEAAKRFLHAPRQEHLCARLNEAEMTAMDDMRSALTALAGAGGGK